MHPSVSVPYRLKAGLQISNLPRTRLHTIGLELIRLRLLKKGSCGFFIPLRFQNGYFWELLPNAVTLKAKERKTADTSPDLKDFWRDKLQESGPICLVLIA